MMLYQRTIRDLHQMLVDREISSVELTDAVFNQIDAVGDKTKAYLLVTRDLALRQAKAADERLRAKSDIRPLTGIPIALKDVLCVKDVASTDTKLAHDKLDNVLGVSIRDQNRRVYPYGSATAHVVGYVSRI